MRKKLFLILKVKLVALVLAPLVLSGCDAALFLGARALRGSAAASDVEEKGPEKSQLQIRELQTRMYDTSDTKMVMKTMLNVLQDDGFIVTEANTELGFLTASKDISVETKGA